MRVKDCKDVGMVTTPARWSPHTPCKEVTTGGWSHADTGVQRSPRTAQAQAWRKGRWGLPVLAHVTGFCHHLHVEPALRFHGHVIPHVMSTLPSVHPMNTLSTVSPTLWLMMRKPPSREEKGFCPRSPTFLEEGQRVWHKDGEENR